DITINRNVNPTLPPVYIEMMSVSGAVTYDEFGRVVKQFHPTVESKSYTINFNYNQQNISIFSQSIYDELDRTVEVINEEGNSSYVDYSIEGNLHMTRSTVPQNESQNIISMTFKDVNGRVVRTNNLEANGEIITEFSYNAIGELLSYTDDMGMTTGYKYDLLGRKLVLDHPDRGVVFYIYDDASNLIRLQTANLESENKFIQYKYDYNRLETIQYPEVENGVENISNVYYTYGEPGTGNQTGKLVCQVDATGRQEYFYGTMGEVTSNIRTVVAPTPELPNRSFTTQFEYDSWNRLQRMIYPDGEQVSYYYDFGGNLNAIKGNHLYIERIDYDYYEQRRYLKYGNGTETLYDYTPELRRLDHLKVLTTNNELLLSNSYNYDFVGNVTRISNSASEHSVNKMGGVYEHGFVYDHLNRLVEASGFFEGNDYHGAIGNDFKSDYVLSMEYNTTHGIVKKSQYHNKNDINYLPNTYDNDYHYFEGTHRVKTIIDGTTGEEEYFGYDLNGNIRSQIQSSGSHKYYLWDESDRLRVAIDEPRLHHYLYDAGGQRVLKASSSMQKLYENGQLVDSSIQMGNYTTYPSAFLVVDPDGVYSKHYYAGTQRIAARVGQESADVLFQETKEPFCLTKGMPRTADELKKLQQEDLQRYLTLGGHTSSLRFESYRVAREVAEAVEETEPGYGQRAQDQIYYYHPDHLGTATFLTDANGLPYEFFLNLPFGETMAEQHSQTSDYQNRWKFTGHELDRETGLYYAGARYYDPRVSIWLSVDPLAERDHSWTPYRYCYNNPINFTDPDGLHEYTYDRVGKLELAKKTTHNYDMLYTKEDYIGKKQNGLKVKNTKILSELIKERDDINQYHFSDSEKKYPIQGVYSLTKNNFDEMKSVFEFLSKNADVEWKLQANGTKDNYLVALGRLTGYFKKGKWIPSTDQAIKFTNVLKGFDKNNVLYDYHNHSGVSWNDFNPSVYDLRTARNILKNSPNAQIFIYMPKLTKDNYNIVKPNHLPDIKTNPNLYLKLDDQFLKVRGY
ncbi:MAG: RHS repeat-associated core domain-containing protein, partial [Flavobacterium sp.]